MLSIRPQKILALVIHQKAVDIAELNTGRAAQLVRSDRFDLPAETSWEKPGVLGARLNEFLRKNRYSARQVVVGLPGKWTLLKAHTLPPSNASAAAAMLRLTIEREYHNSAREWSFDYLMQQAGAQATHVLLAAAPRARLEQVIQVLAGAGLTVMAAVPTTITLAMAAPVQGDAAALHVSQDGAELAVWHAGRLVTVQRLISPLDAPAAVTAEVARMLAMHGVAIRQMGVHDTTADPATGQKWEERLGMAVRLEAAEKGGNLAGQLAAVWAREPAATLDFAHSRLALAKASRFTRLHVLAASTVLLVLLVVGYLGVDWYLQWHAVNDLQDQLKAINTQLVSAQSNVGRLDHARGWYDTRPALLSSMRALTLAFPTNGQVWTTSLIIRDDLTGTLAGKAQDERGAIDLIERLRSSASFGDVKLLYLRQADRTSRAVSFALNFSYTGKEQGR